MVLKIHFLLFIFCCFIINSFSQQTAVYDITFTSVWNTTDHSDSGTIPLPGNAHWSNLVGATHNASIKFFEPGTTASQGIKDVSEIGVNTAFNSEVNTAITNNTADQWLQMAVTPNPSATGSATLTTITVSEDYPLLTLVSMIAPSPDWFMGVDSFSLLDGSNNWKPSQSFDVFIYDAGTDNGITYIASDAVTIPQGTISSLINVPPFNNQKIGTLQITFISSSLSVDDNFFDRQISIYPNPINDEFHITNSSNTKITAVEIYDLLGKVVQKELYQKTLNISSLQTGIYFAKIKLESNQTVIRKLIKK